MELQTFCRLIVICAMMPLFDCSTWINSYDNVVDFTCPSRNEHIYHFQSIHSDNYEDRKFKFNCRLATKDPVQCRWKGWANDMDQPFVFQCPRGGYINGIQSNHSDSHEDRIFRFHCCSRKGQIVKKCIFHGWSNSFDKAVDFAVRRGRVLTGVASIHDNNTKDRIFQFQTCKLGKRVCINRY